MHEFGSWLCRAMVVAFAVTLVDTPAQTADLYTGRQIRIAGAKADSPLPGATDVVWISLVNVSTNGNSLQKTSGCDGCADAGAISQQQITSGSGYVQFTASEVGTLRAIGLSTGNPGTSVTEIKFALVFQPGGVAEVRESGAYRIDTPFASGDTFRIAVQSGGGSATIRYYKNGKLIYRSAVTPEYPLLVDTALLSRSATISNVVLYKAP
ncbi:MAG: hypothetical protein C5B48_11870 [Candidatus Rokuibacteriota bacterium]|nr:MAG: hypothetical protein C5B48_11870 [Candidatus Rokubacteria bacterium]